MVPFKNAAYRVVKTIIDILVPKEAGQVLNKKRFEEDFTGGELMMPKKNPKPEDYELTFTGNTDDTFRLGMTVTKKTLKVEFFSYISLKHFFKFSFIVFFVCNTVQYCLLNNNSDVISMMNAN